MNLATVIEVSFWMILPLGVLGSLLHFLIDWTKHNRLVAVFAAVNESYWEHIKIAVWPVMLAQLALFLSGGHQNPSFIPAATIALYSIPISMVGLVFAYKTLTKRNILWVDITVFFMTIAIAQTLFILVLDQLRPTLATIIFAVFFLLGLIVAFGLFTLRPPREPDPFIDPLNQKYGLSAHPDIETRSTKQP
jgi:hypothetical protein